MDETRDRPIPSANLLTRQPRAAGANSPHLIEDPSLSSFFRLFNLLNTIRIKRAIVPAEARCANLADFRSPPNPQPQCTVICTDPILFSQASEIVPFLPPRSFSVYRRFSTSEGAASIVIFARPRSWALSYAKPHCPVCLLTINSQLSGSEMSKNKGKSPFGP